MKLSQFLVYILVYSITVENYHNYTLCNTFQTLILTCYCFTKYQLGSILLPIHQQTSG